MSGSFFKLAVIGLLALPPASSLGQSSPEELIVMVADFEDRDALDIPVTDVVISWLNDTFSNLNFITVVPLRQSFPLSNDGLLAAAEVTLELGGDIVLTGAFIQENDGIAVGMISVICTDCPLQYDIVEGYYEYEYSFDPASLTADTPPPDKFTLLAKLFTASWLFAVNRHEESADLLEAALDNTEGALPDHIYWASCLAGILCADLDRSAGAVEALTTALTIHPDDHETLSMRASAYDALQMYDQAVSDLEAALELDPANPAYRAQLGAQLYQAGRPDEAMEYLNPSIESDPSNAMALRDRARTYYGMGDLETALSDINRALELEPLNSQGCAMRGIIMWEMGRVEEALEDFNAAISLEKDSVAKSWCYMGRANCLMELGDYSEAVSDLEHAMSVFYDFYSGHFMLGKCYLELGDYDAARSSLETFLECPVILSPSDPFTTEEMTGEAEALLESLN